MDEAWAIEQLETWIELESVYFSNASGRYTQNIQKAAEAYSAMWDMHDNVQRILNNARSGLGNTTLVNSNQFTTRVQLDLIRLALGILRNRETAARKLGSPAPTMAADALHSLVWEAAKGLWNDGHYGQAVQRAASYLNTEVQTRLGRYDVSDQGLMTQAFSSQPPEVGKPRLRWPGDPSDLMVKTMNDGLRGYAPGCFQTIRNPATHGTTDIKRQVALEQLAALSLLARWTEQCEVVSA